ncbi:hypothetical protein [Campylobacter sp.]|uniref:hypothetical protein n=1 Tax=Campylobacter sp. TaxID=205 RepID=UPI002A834DE1|nr:hypothetical protein [Campylobacter sp.]MDY4445756.1 hypothetical protein [Campylobacter sp.]
MSNTNSTLNKNTNAILAKSDLNHAENLAYLYEPDFLIVNALYKGEQDLVALNGLKYKSTRISNYIVEIRKYLDGFNTIKTERVRYNPYNKRKWYGKYILNRDDSTIQKIKELLDKIKNGFKILTKTKSS